MIVRILYMFIALAYSIGVTGMHVNLHWCSGELASMNINTLDHGSCGCDDEREADGCCADAGIYFKVDNSHSASSGSVLPAFVASAACLAPKVNLNYSFVGYQKAYRNIRQDVLPPPDIVKKNCCFLI